MIHDLDETIRHLLRQGASAGSSLLNADIKFDVPDAAWRLSLTKLTVNCYLYDINENREMRTHEPLRVRSADHKRVAEIGPPRRVDCSYCITAWSMSTTEPVLEEHRLLSEVLLVILRHPTIPRSMLQGSLVDQIAPYPTVIASQGGEKNPDFWQALDQRLKPSLNYVVTLAVLLDVIPADAALPSAVQTVVDNTDQTTTAP
jgi:hypothetical protein